MKEEGSIYVDRGKLLALFNKKPFESKNSILQASLIVTKYNEEMLLFSVKCFMHRIGLDKVLNDLQIIFKR